MEYYGRKLLLTSNLTSNATPSQLPAQPPEAVNLEADFVVVLASLLCAIACVLGIVVVARCAWMRRGTGGWRFGVGGGNAQLANKGVKKKVLNALPKYTHKAVEEVVVVEGVAEVVVVVEDCAICLAEYVDGDEIRVLPQCGHRFHVQCIDVWLGSHSSCPSCRQILAGPRCRNCGEIPAVSPAGDRSRGGGGGGGGNDFVKVRSFSYGASTSALMFLP